MKKTKPNMDWLMTHCEQCSQRYREAESFIVSLIEMPWYKEIIPFYVTYKQVQFIQHQKDKYNF